MFARISVRFGLRDWGLGVVFGIDTVRGAGVRSLLDIFTSRSSKSASEDVVDEAAERGKGWVRRVACGLGFRGIMTLCQRCL